MFELSKSRKKIIVLQCIVWLHTVVLGNYKGRLKLLFSLDTTLGEIVESLLSSASKPVKKYNMFSLKGKYYFHILFYFQEYMEIIYLDHTIIINPKIKDCSHSNLIQQLHRIKSCP